MSAMEALRAARALGVELTIEGNDLLLESASEPPAAAVEALVRHKAEIIKLLGLVRLFGRRMTGGFSSRRERQLQNLMAGYHGPTPRRRPSNAASSNGLIGIQLPL
jgi:hypothetical protein